MGGRIILGAGEQTWDGWRATQREQLDLTDRASFARFFGTELADAFLCEHVWEHLSLPQGQAAARLCWRYLQPGGVLRVAVPDAHFPDPEYQRTVQVGGPGPAGHPAADHQIVYDARTFAEVFTQAGFEVVLLEYHDPSGRFHAQPWSPEAGPVYRSARLDHRNAEYRAGRGPLGFASIILDARKPA
ncbi:class I SAM-dependent methyltransferase [Deinococcus alpinitundrae]|uniref:class I SAM-dependent methyltransferase n=1 Tax=Deinococcus alpinitundrae TaxID=468913 RepID=UPI001379990E|nr:methyltransferase domain-containing protein [Deinococcus alpinitundrae]